MDLKNTKNEEAEILSLADQLVIDIPTLIKCHHYNDAIEGLHLAIALYYKINRINKIGPLIQKILEIYRLKRQYNRKKREKIISEGKKKEKKHMYEDYYKAETMKILKIYNWEKDREYLKKMIEDLKIFYPKGTKLKKKSKDNSSDPVNFYDFSNLKKRK